MYFNAIILKMTMRTLSTKERALVVGLQEAGIKFKDIVEKMYMSCSTIFGNTFSRKWKVFGSMVIWKWKVPSIIVAQKPSQWYKLCLNENKTNKFLTIL